MLCYRRQILLISLYARKCSSNHIPTFLFCLSYVELVAVTTFGTTNIWFFFLLEFAYIVFTFEWNPRCTINVFIFFFLLNMFDSTSFNCIMDIMQATRTALHYKLGSNNVEWTCYQKQDQASIGTHRGRRLAPSRVLVLLSGASPGGV